MGNHAEASTLNYHLLMLGGERYRSTKLDDLPSVATDFRIIRRVFTRRLRRPYQMALPRLRSHSKPDGVRSAINLWSQGLGSQDIVTVYYSGHGLPTPGRLYLALQDTDPDLLAATALPAEDLVRAVLEPGGVEHLLVILDTCHAGTGGADIVRAGRALQDGQPLGSPTAQVRVIGRTGSREPAGPTPAFAAAFEAAVLSPESGGNQQEWLSVELLLHHINLSMPSEELGRPMLVAGRQHGPCVPLPNPRWDPVRADATIADQRALRRGHAAGRKVIETKLPMFEGRAAAIEAIRTWQGGIARDFVGCVVTGDIGSGKSALLRHLSTAVINATGLGVEGLTQAIGAAAGVETSDPHEVIRLLAEADAAEVWIDGADEAIEPSAVDWLLRSLLESAGTEHDLRLVIGTRRSHVTTVSGDASVLLIDLDQPPYRDVEAMESYVGKVLAARRTDSAVEAIVTEADGTSFLVAGLLARGQAAGSPPSGASSSPDGSRDLLDRALEAEISRLASLEGALGRQDTVNLLRSLAYAKGVGLPWSHWRAIASALGESTVYGDGDLERLLDTAGDLLREDIDADGISVYQLHHKVWVEHLRRDQDDAATAAVITEKLIERVPLDPVTTQRDWLSADSYTRNHLADHAADCGRLAEPVEDPLYQVAANPVHLSRALRFAAVRSEASDVFRLAYHNLGPHSAYSERISHLELAALQLGFARRISALNIRRTWRPLWVDLSQPDHRVMIEARSGYVLGLDLGAVDSEVVAITGGEDGYVHVWNLADGQQRLSLEASAGRVNAVKFATVDSVPMAILATEGVVQVWDIQQGRFMSEFSGHDGRVRLGIGTVEGRTVVISADQWGGIWAWNPVNGGAIRQFVPEQIDRGEGASRFADEVAGIAMGQLEGQTTLAVVSGDGTVTHWRYDSAELVATLEGPGYPYPSMSAAGSSGVGTLALMFGQAGYPWQIWSPALGASSSQNLPIRRPEGVAIHDLPDITLSTMVRDGLVEVWDLSTRAILHQAEFVGIYATETALRRTANGYTVAVGGNDGRVRVYEFLDKDTWLRKSKRQNNGTSSVAIDPIGPRPAAAVAGRRTKLVDLRSGAKKREFKKPFDMVRRVRFGTAEGKSAVVEGDDTGSVRVWATESGRQISSWLTGHGWTLALAVGSLNDREVVLTGGQGPEVEVRDLVTGELIGTFTVGDYQQVTDLHIAHVGDRTFAVATSNGPHSIWDLADRRKVTDIGHGVGRKIGVVRQTNGDCVVAINRNGQFIYIDPLAGSHVATNEICELDDAWPERLVVTSSPLGNLALTSGDTGEVRVANLNSGSVMTAVHFDQPVLAMDACWDDDSNSLLVLAGMPNGSACVSIEVES